MEAYHFMKIVSPSQAMKILNIDQTFEQENVKDGATLVLLGQSSFTWDLNYKGSNIQLLNNCLTANKRQEMNFETVLATVGFSSGKHYWEVKLDLFNELEDIFIGITTRNVNIYARASDVKNWWGWLCTW